MKIYTKTGDKGKTSLFDGEKVEKDSLRVESYGTLDELVSVLGIAKNYLKKDDDLFALINEIQKKLFSVSAELATRNIEKIKSPTKEEDVIFLEKNIDEIMNKTKKVTHFILPGSSKSSAFLHLARTVCRRAERIILSLSRTEEINPFILKFINRLSDCLYAMARLEEDKIEEVNL